MPKKSQNANTPKKSKVLTNLAETAVEPAITQLVEIFSQRMSDIEFPGVSASSLTAGREAVVADHNALMQAQEALVSARERVSALEATLSESRAQLLKDALRAKGYATVFAEDDPALLKQVRGLNLKIKKSKSAKKAKVKAVKEKVQEVLVDASEVTMEPFEEARTDDLAA